MQALTGHSTRSSCPLITATEGGSIPEEIRALLSSVLAPFSRLDIRIDDSSSLRSRYGLQAEVPAATAAKIPLSRT